MKNSYLLCLVFLVFACTKKENQATEKMELPATPVFEWTTMDVATKVSFRGLHAYSDKIIWASGSNATYTFTEDGGITWHTAMVPDVGELQFRDVQVLNDSSVLLLSAGQPARVYKTNNKGKTWTVQYENLTEGVFFDAMDFWDENNGLAFSDPVNNKLIVIKTQDAGKHWSLADTVAMPMALEGEAGFAASGSCLVTGPGGKAWIGLGGLSGARIFKSTDFGATWQAHLSPVLSGAPSRGIFGLAYAKDQLLAVGGDYAQDTLDTHVFAYLPDGEEGWRESKVGPFGFRSAIVSIAYKEKPIVLACGTSGVDLAQDDLSVWENISQRSFNSISYSKGAERIWFAGDEGKISSLRIK